MSLILPKRYQKNRRDYIDHISQDFGKKLEKFINEHDEMREPYFVLFKANTNHFKPNERKEAMSLYIKRPPLMKNSMVFWVDNTRGACILLWTISSDGKAKFNHKAGYQLKGILRAANV